ncbi:SDR family NAD(P)-dependent oxidoreductase [Anaerolinea thermophila]|uniref:SDR family NAD(P)-dependent oxidoreductase n=2 Tax=Anaerolinea TaxID=233189 RepID=UPI0026ED76F3|nr:SDR family NAD(P)-dependent oxidoreductase [Anaerolinea thermophila]
MARYLVTGAAGFIAARVCEMLLEQGDEVIGVDNLCTAYDVRLKHYRLNRLLPHENFTFHGMDISDRRGVDALVGACAPLDGIINLAARAGVRASVEDPWVFVETNVTGTLNLLEAARRHGVSKFILASTSSIYGENAPLPTPEDAPSDRPLQPYSASKKGAEAMCHAYHFLYGLDVTIFRYFTVYGPAGRPDMVMFRFTQWIAEGRPVHLNGDGEQSRGFTYVDDIARGTILGLKPLGYEIINLGGHEVITINQMIARLEQYIGRKAQVVHHPAHRADMLANQADVSKARALLGWEPQVGLDEGMRRLVDWYMAERSWAKDILTD